MKSRRVVQIVVGLVGLLFVAGAYPLTMSLWRASSSEYEAMLLSLYVTLGVFMLLAVRNPSANRSLIAFAAWSSLAHAAVMAIQAGQHPDDRGDLLGGVVLFGIVGIALIALAPAKQSQDRTTATGA